MVSRSFSRLDSLALFITVSHVLVSLRISEDQFSNIVMISSFKISVLVLLPANDFNGDSPSSKFPMPISPDPLLLPVFFLFKESTSIPLFGVPGATLAGPPPSRPSICKQMVHRVRKVFGTASSLPAKQGERACRKLRLPAALHQKKASTAELEIERRAWTRSWAREAGKRGETREASREAKPHLFLLFLLVIVPLVNI